MGLELSLGAETYPPVVDAIRWAGLVILVVGTIVALVSITRSGRELTDLSIAMISAGTVFSLARELYEGAAALYYAIVGGLSLVTTIVAFRAARRKLKPDDGQTEASDQDPPEESDYAEREDSQVDGGQVSTNHTVIVSPSPPGRSDLGDRGNAVPRAIGSFSLGLGIGLGLGVLLRAKQSKPSHTSFLTT